jgi:predicted MFS family arabinose efflux permease
MIFVSRDIAFPTGVLGMIFACGGIGAVAGAAWAPALGRRVGAGRAIAIGLALYSLGVLCVPLIVTAGWLGAALLVAQQVVGDLGHTVLNVHDRGLRQTAVPPDLLARADGGIRSIGLAATLLGALGGGGLATVAGTRSTLALAAALGALAALLAFATLARRP